MGFIDVGIVFVLVYSMGILVSEMLDFGFYMGFKFRWFGDLVVNCMKNICRWN